MATDVAYDATGAAQSTTLPARTVWVGSIATPGVAAVTVQGRNTFGEVTHERDANGGITVTGYDVIGAG
jgi:hypothetical protein